MLDGRPILQHVLDALHHAGIRGVVVVLGDDAERVEAAIEWRRERRVRNPDPGRGLSSSVRAGIGAVPASSTAALIVLADQPLLDPDVVRSIAAAPFDASRPIVVARYPAGRGNPVRLERAGFPLVERLDADEGLRAVMRARPELVREVAAEGSNPDVDTAADLVAIAALRGDARAVTAASPPASRLPADETPSDAGDHRSFDR